MYHSIPPRYDQSPWSVSRERFDEQMRCLLRRGRRCVSVRELLRMRQNGAGSGLVGLTFDDGFADFAECALPVLERCGFTATIFLVAGKIGGSGDWAKPPPKSLMTADQVRYAADAGIEIGSHSLSHSSLLSVGEARLLAEIESSRRILREITGQAVDGFCYPFGHHDERVVEQVRVAGYNYGCAVAPSAQAGRLAIPRIYVGESDSSRSLRAKIARYRLLWGYNGPGGSLPLELRRLSYRVRR